MATLFCATVTLLRHACFTSARPMPVTGERHSASEPLSIRNFSAGSALVSCKPVQPRHCHCITVLATSARVDAKRQLDSLETR